MISYIKRYLPHDIVRTIRARQNPEGHERLQALRSAPVTDKDSVSLAPALQRQALFIHVPKCAGLSVNREIFGCRGSAHIPAEALRFAFTGKEWSQLFKFTFVRNPWDRLVSAYFFLKDGGLGESDQKHAEASVNQYSDFQSFVTHYLPQPERLNIVHFRPQTSFICDHDTGKPLVDYIGRVEKLDADMDIICERIGIERSHVRTNSGKTRPQSYRDQYDEKTRDIVAKIYADDIKLLGYTF